MKKVLFLSLLAPMLWVAQSNDLSQKFKVEAGFQGLNFGFEQPLSKKMLLDINAGIGGRVNIPAGSSIEYRLGVTSSETYLSPFFRTQLRYYFNRDARAARNHSLENNSGSFIGFQTKMVFNKSVDDVLVSDVHFGQQLPLGKHWIYRYHLGVGLGFNLAQGMGAFYPAVGSTFGYVF